MYKAELEDISNDYTSELSIVRNNVVISQYSDGGEPEDNSFIRDWSWVVRELNKAYEYGIIDGQNQMKNEYSLGYENGYEDARNNALYKG